MANGLPDNIIFEVYEDHRHRIWFRSYSGRLAYYYNGKIYSLGINEEIVKGQNNAKSTSMYVDPGDTLWVGLNASWLLKITLRDSTQKLDVIKGEKRMYIYETPGYGYIWGGAIKHHIGDQTVIKKDEAPCTYTLHLPFLAGTTPYITARARGDYILSTRDRLYILDEGELIYHTIAEGVIALREDPQGNVWISNRTDGTVCYPGGDFSQAGEKYFKDLIITDVYLDAEGGYWFSSLSSGVFYMPNKKIRTYTSGMTDRNVRCISKVSDNIVAVGYSNGSLQRFNSVTEEFSLITHPGIGPIEDIVSDKKGNTWVGAQYLMKNDTVFKTFSEKYALSAQMNPHFIFNSLNSIQCFILESDMRGAYKYLGKFSKLVRQTLNNSRKEMIPLSEELDTLKLYIDLEAMRFKDSFTYTIEVSEAIRTDDISVPALMIQPFVENAIWHGLLPKEKDRKLRILIMPGDRTVKCIIEDNGVGRRIAKLPSQRGNNYESMGIAVTRERLEGLNAKYNVSLSLHIIDLYDDNDRPCGTRVELFFPLI